MDYEEPVTKKRSLGALRKAQKKKPQSPDFTGQFRFQRHTFEAIGRQFADCCDDEVVANLAGWINQDHSGQQFLTVEVSPKFVSKQSSTPKPNDFDLLFKESPEDA
jgi:hypothetical protein